MATNTTAQRLSRDGGSIAYDVTGTGPLIVCVPGMGDLRSSYRFTVPALVEAGYRVATMDLRGHGDSDATFADYDDVAAGGDVLALIDELGGPAVVLGNSMGAAAAAWAAAERPELVRGLVLVGPFVRNPSIGAATQAMFRLVTSGPWAVSMWKAYLPKLFPGRRPDDFAAHRKAIADSMRRKGYRAAFSRTTRTDHGPVEARLDEVVGRPTLVVMGEADPDFPDAPAEARWIGERLGAEVLLVPSAGHYPQAEYPEVVNPAVVRFFETVAQDA